VATKDKFGAEVPKTEDRHMVNENGLGLTAKKHEGNWNPQP
jgi:hypothetical protein